VILTNLKIRTKLVVTFSIIAITTIGTLGVALYFLADVNRRFDTMAQDHIAALELTLKTTDSTHQNVSTLDKISAIDQADQPYLFDSLDKQWGDIVVQIETLFSLRPAFSQNLILEIDNIALLRNQLPMFRRVSDDLLATQINRHKTRQGVIEHDNRIRTWLAEQIDQSQQSVTSHTERDRLKIDQYINRTGALFQLYNDIGILSSGLMATFDQNDLVQLNQKARDALYLYRKVYQESQSQSINGRSYPSQWLEDIKPLIIGTQSVFNERRRQLRLKNVLRTLLQKHESLSLRIIEETNIIAKQMREVITRDTNDLGLQLDLYRRILVVSTAISLITIALIVWLLVGRQIISPIIKTRKSMIEISQGNIEAIIPTAANDEIGDMLVALKKLREFVVQVDNLAQYDGLTQLYNRGHFDKALNDEIRRCKRENSSLSLLMCDIDYFKNYNDGYGHLAGDNCLKICGHIIKSEFNRITDQCCRYGGEEFAIIMYGTDRHSAYNMASKLCDIIRSLQLKHEYSKCADVITFSIGIVSATASELSNTVEIIGSADKALYQAKSQGRNRVVEGV
jgi:diguanylate cyclase (GGDEF)-like protein